MKKTAIIGIGNRLKGDDYIGSYIANNLKNIKVFSKKKNILIIDCEDTPENYIFDVVKFAPDRILFIDAAFINKKPGEFKLLSPAEIDNLTTSTHTISLKLTIDLILSEIKPEIIILGIQPENLLLNAKMSKSLKNSIPNIIEKIKELVKAQNLKVQ